MNLPEHPQAREFFQQAYRLQMAGELDQAVDYYRRSISVEPTAEAHTFLGWTYSHLGRIDDAIAECKRAIKVDPDFGNPYNDIGAYLLQTGDWPGAIPWLQQAKLAPRYDNPEFAYMNLGRVYELQQLLMPAMEQYQAALELAPGAKAALDGLQRIRAYFN